MKSRVVYKVSRPQRWPAVVGAEGEPPTDVCEPVAVNLSLLAAHVSRQGRIVSPNVSPQKLMFASRVD